MIGYDDACCALFFIYAHRTIVFYLYKIPAARTDSIMSPNIVCLGFGSVLKVNHPISSIFSGSPFCTCAGLICTAYRIVIQCVVAPRCSLKTFFMPKGLTSIMPVHTSSLISRCKHSSNDSPNSNAPAPQSQFPHSSLHFALRLWSNTPHYHRVTKMKHKLRYNQL